MGNKGNSNPRNGNKPKKPFYNDRKDNDSNGQATNTNSYKTAVRELRFHIHYSDKRKNSETFAKIKESIVLKI